MLIINIDGASRGNPGLSGIGIVITKGNSKILEYKEFIGKKTNKHEEYADLKKELKIELVLDNEITILSDSELVVNQRNNRYKVRNKQIKMISREISNLEGGFKTVIYKHISREENGSADLLANQAIDENNKYQNPSN